MSRNLKKILVLGSTGMLGHVINLRLSENKNFKVIAVSRDMRESQSKAYGNVTDNIKMEEVFAKHNPDIVINCTALLVKESELYQKDAVYINALFPKLLEHRFKESSTKVIHISTPGVFSGREGNYKENDFTDATTFYGRTKAIGEIANDKDLTIRSDFWGPDPRESGTGIFNWVMQQKGNIQGYATKYFNGVSSIECSDFIIGAIEDNLSGIFHLVANEKISKAEFLNKVVTNINSSILVNSVKTADYSDYSIVKTDCCSYNNKAYDKMLNDVNDWLSKHKNIYTHYKLRTK